MPDLQSQVIETVIGLAFVYFLLSVIVSGLTEAVAWFVGRRATNLEHGLRQLISDDEKLAEVREHPLIKRLGKPPIAGWLERMPFGRNRRAPSYIPSRTFALAFLDTFAPPAGDAGGDPGEDVIARLRDSVDDLPEGLKGQLVPLLDEAGDSRDRLRASIETWFDDQMERVAGWYTRWAFLVTLVFALLITVAANADSARIAERLWDDDTVRASVVAAASETAASDPGAEAAAEGGNAAQAAVQELDSLSLPIGWDGANDVDAVTPLGWLVTFLAVAMGAPFWFNALGRLGGLRATGNKPASS